MASSFRYYVWDPWLLLLQIMTLQSVYYAILSIFAAVTAHAVEAPLSIDLIFNEEALDIWQIYGVFIAGSICMAFAVYLVGRRAKQCLDFATTLFFIHLCLCWHHDGLPRRLSWWLLQSACVAITAVLGEYVCIQAEMNTSIDVADASTPSKSKS
eukprot:TRINITY_DN2809_c0_g1_i2.p1 TRINITY_DN2809_c0_g1~~TRINITY_DN2809_c0_g1_i2.p1  ORF type:complete len:155 (+),score=23.18 TRINITY_DN2809_c0_g1_i2:116-580(+)